jgi:hypothetical protein
MVLENGPSANRFFRKGKIGSWREKLSDKQAQRIVHITKWLAGPETAPGSCGQQYNC